MGSSAEYSNTRRANFLALLRVVDIPLVALLALAIYFATAYELVDRMRLMPLAHGRLLNSKELLLERAATTERDVFVLGSSVVVDGVDCKVVNKQLEGLSPATQSFNIAWAGSGPGRWPLIEPALAKAHPAAVVFEIDFPSALTNAPMPRHMAAVAGWFNFVPADYRPTLEKLMDPENEVGPLFAPRLKQLLEFRVLPLVHLEVTLRETLRSDLRYDGYDKNFEAPWLRRTTVSPAAMARSIKQNVEQLKGARVENFEQTAKLIKLMADKMHEAGAVVIFVLAPMNPEVLGQLPPDFVKTMSAPLEAAAKESGSIFLDQSEMLPASGFSDHIHPIGEGRDQWSAAIGQAVRAALQGDKQPHAVSDT